VNCTIITLVAVSHSMLFSLIWFLIQLSLIKIISDITTLLEYVIVYKLHIINGKKMRIDRYLNIKYYKYKLY
jgi:hypothetical protein